MVKVDKVNQRNGNKITAVLFADAKADIVSNMSIGNDIIDFGSRVVTADGDVGQYDSDGTWHWLGE